MYVDRQELEVYDVAFQLGNVYVDNPFIVIMLYHGDGLEHVPSSENILVAGNGKPLLVGELRGAHLEAHGDGIIAQRHGQYLAAAYAVSEGRTVKVGIVGQVYPMVVHGNGVAAQGVKLEPVGLVAPFAPHHVVLAAHHAVIIINVCALAQVYLQVACPFTAVYGPHSVWSRQLDAVFNSRY